SIAWSRPTSWSPSCGPSPTRSSGCTRCAAGHHPTWPGRVSGCWSARCCRPSTSSASDRSSVRAELVLSAAPGRDRHDTGRSHPERPQRLAAALAGVADAGLGSDLVEVDARAATMDELTRVHDSRYLQALVDFADAGGGFVDPDTVVSPGS